MSLKVNPLVYVAALPATAILGLAGVLFFRGVHSSNLRPYDHEAYLQNPQSLEGNTYLARGTIHQQLVHDGARGRVIAVKIFDESGVPRAKPVAICIPTVLSQTVSFEVGQRFEFTVVVGKHGKIEAQKIKPY